MPVRVIVGSDDALLRSSETRERIERHVKGARVLYLDGVGHILPPQTAAPHQSIAAGHGKLLAEAIFVLNSGQGRRQRKISSVAPSSSSGRATVSTTKPTPESVRRHVATGNSPSRWRS